MNLKKKKNHNRLSKDSNSLMRYMNPPSRYSTVPSFSKKKPANSIAHNITRCTYRKVLFKSNSNSCEEIEKLHEAICALVQIPYRNCAIIATPKHLLNRYVVSPSINHCLRHHCYSTERGIVWARPFNPPLL